MISLELKYPFGTCFYFVEKKEEDVYAPCVTCGNDRFLTAFGNDGEKYMLPCPKCKASEYRENRSWDKRIKGDVNNVYVQKTYTIKTFTLKQVALRFENDVATPMVVFGDYSREFVPLNVFENERVGNKDDIDFYVGSAYRDYDVKLFTTEKAFLEALIEKENKQERANARKIRAGIPLNEGGK